MRDSHDDRRCDLRKHHVRAARTLQHPLHFAVNQFFPTSAAELIVTIPHKQMPCGRSCKDAFLRLHWTDIKHLIKTKLANLGIRSYFSQKVFFLPYRKKINTRRHFSSQYIFVVILPLLISQKLQFSIIFQIYRSLSKTKHPAACMRYFLFI